VAYKVDFEENTAKVLTILLDKTTKKRRLP
jgi:hypothetical protein